LINNSLFVIEFVFVRLSLSVSCSPEGQT